MDKLFGIHEQALHVRSKRAELIANNIANADTPGFAAKDIDFRKVLQQYEAQAPKTTPLIESDFMEGLMYRKPFQPSLDKNTVDVQLEKSEYLDNSLRFQASLRFLDGRIKGILQALRGE